MEKSTLRVFHPFIMMIMKRNNTELFLDMVLIFITSHSHPQWENFVVSEVHFPINLFMHLTGCESWVLSLYIVKT